MAPHEHVPMSPVVAFNNSTVFKPTLSAPSYLSGQLQHFHSTLFNGNYGYSRLMGRESSPQCEICGMALINQSLICRPLIRAKRLGILPSSSFTKGLNAETVGNIVSVWTSGESDTHFSFGYI